MVSVSTPESGTMGGASHNKSVTFNSSAAMKQKLEDKMKELKELREKQEELEKANKDKTDGKSSPLAA